MCSSGGRWTGRTGITCVILCIILLRSRASVNNLLLFIIIVGTSSWQPLVRPYADAYLSIIMARRRFRSRIRVRISRLFPVGRNRMRRLRRNDLSRPTVRRGFSRTAEKRERDSCAVLERRARRRDGGAVFGSLRPRRHNNKYVNATSTSTTSSWAACPRITRTRDTIFSGATTQIMCWLSRRFYRVRPTCVFLKPNRYFHLCFVDV